MQLTNTLDENRQFRHVSSHTMQEPLRKLQVFSGMLIDAIRQKDAAKAEHLALRIKTGAERFSSLIKELSRFSDLQEENTSFQQTDLEYIIEMVHAEFRPKLQEKKSVVRVGALPVIWAVSQQIEELFYHLFDNAIKFSKKDLPLEISVSCKQYVSDINTQLSHEKRYIEIEVKDNGVGIDETQLEKIFDMFSQLPSGADHQGVGMGLTICRKIIRNHAGVITIKSQTGIGTSVSVIMPGEFGATDHPNSEIEGRSFRLA
ncbi:sensor histidine kinase [Dyadobacter frigoris]|uniref:sensor histidine kinase n=1 Tax=Dyadobacter frigoris TaxID=2576211 RepID=UPI0025558176|nr:ATP-binding protein [Dyadobacter frigoris]